MSAHGVIGARSIEGPSKRLRWLSQFVPMRLRERYISDVWHDDGSMLDEEARWWQWRGRILGHVWTRVIA